MAAESKLERYLIQRCKVCNVLCYKFVSPGHRGVPDRVLIGPRGTVVFLELKGPGKKLSALQEREIQILNNHFANAVWADQIFAVESAIGLASR